MDMGLFQRDTAKIIAVSTDTATYWEKSRTRSFKKNLKGIKQFWNLKTKEAKL